ncbi:MAG TPA: tetratricopeptide repeat protein, partial [Caldilineaceae bacterium]|nr:tetratricopeptide repeat protein [Caldilineaceae bacterium]
LGLPESLHELALARVDRLPEEAKLTLKVASVVGRIFEFDVLARAHPALPEPDQLRAQLSLLHERELVMPVKADGLWPVADGPEAEARPAPPATRHPPLVYTFQHNLTQEVVYETLLASQQQELHWAIGDALEQAQPGAVERLAHHYTSADLSRAETRQRALHYLDRAAAKARQDFANETALRFLDQALSLEERWAWHKARVELLHLLGRRSEEASALAALASWPDAPPDELALLESRYDEAVNDYDAATAAAHRLLDIARAGGRRDLEAAGLVQLASIAGREGNYAQEGAYYRQALAVVEDSLAPAEAAIDIHYGLGTVYRQQGEYEAAEEHYQAALALARRNNRLADEARVLTALGVVAQRMRRLDVALQYAERSLGIRRLVGDRAGESASLLSAANVLTDDLGDYGRGLVLLKQALAIEQRLRNRWAEASVLNSLGIVHLLIGRLDEAADYLQRALAICEEIGAAAGQAHVLCNLGQVQREQGKLAEAAASFARGLTLAESLGDPLTQAQYWSEMGLLALRQGKPVDAARLAVKAAAQLRELEVEALATADLCTFAEASHALGDGERAWGSAHEALALLDACGGSGPDYPHRDYYRCAAILEAYDDQAAAARARAAAYRLLMERAARISDPEVRASYLQAIPIHSAIVAEGN